MNAGGRFSYFGSSGIFCSLLTESLTLGTDVGMVSSGTFHPIVL